MSELGELARLIAEARAAHRIASEAEAREDVRRRYLWADFHAWRQSVIDEACDLCSSIRLPEGEENT